MNTLTMPTSSFFALVSIAVISIAALLVLFFKIHLKQQKDHNDSTVSFKHQQMQNEDLIKLAQAIKEAGRERQAKQCESKSKLQPLNDQNLYEGGLRFSDGLLGTTPKWNNLKEADVAEEPLNKSKREVSA